MSRPFSTSFSFHSLHKSMTVIFCLLLLMLQQSKARCKKIKGSEWIMIKVRRSKRICKIDRWIETKIFIFLIFSWNSSQNAPNNKREILASINAVKYKQQWISKFQLDFFLIFFEYGRIKAIAFMVIYKVNMSQSISPCHAACLCDCRRKRKNHQSAAFVLIRQFGSQNLKSHFQPFLFHLHKSHHLFFSRFVLTQLIKLDLKVNVRKF